MAEVATDNEYKECVSHRHTPGVELTLICKPAIKKTIVPVIYIPGIFGSRLENPGGEGEKGRFVWDPNRGLTLIGKYAKSVTSMFSERYWKDSEIEDKVLRMHNPGATVMKDHNYDGKNNDNDSILSHILNSPTFKRLSQQYDRQTRKDNEWVTYDNDQITYTDLAKKLAQEEYDRRSERGWYGVWNSYDPLLEAIHELTDPEFIYPVYAFGYDWRFDLDKAAEKLVTRISKVMAVQDYPDFGERGKQYEKVHNKVIIVTHSQGSMVARYALTKLCADEKVQAVVHLDQPTTGAPILYQRFITGTGPERTIFGLSDKAFGAILGNNSYHFTKMAAPLTGALSLLPTNDYTAKQGDAKHQWLNSNHPHLSFDKPVADVYDDIYLSEKFGLINCKRYDAAGQPKPYQEKEFERVRNPITMDEYPRHFYGDKPLPPYAEILPPPADNPYRRDNHRLRPHVGLEVDALLDAAKYWEKFSIKIGKAKTFHADLGLDQHKETHVVRARGVKTVTQVTFNLNDKGMLECPLLRTKDGDGTVPLTSQEALLFTDKSKAQSAGMIIEDGEHAAICTHPEALKQVKELLTVKFVAELRAQPQSKPA